MSPFSYFLSSLATQPIVTLRLEVPQAGTMRKKLAKRFDGVFSNSFFFYGEFLRKFKTNIKNVFQNQAVNHESNHMRRVSGFLQ